MMHRIVLLVALTASGCNTHQSSGVTKSEQRQVSAFSEVEIHGAFQLEAAVGGSPELKLVADDDVLPLITSEVRGKRLVLSMKKNNLIIKHKLFAHITAPDLTLIKASGAARIAVKGIDNEALRLDFSGAAHATLSGKTRELGVEISGAGSVLARALKSERAIVNCSGAARVEVFTAEALDVDISGAGKVNYWGDPKDVKKNITGVGSVEKR